MSNKITLYVGSAIKKVTARGGSTTNLFHHLKQWHKLQYEECVKLRAAEAPAASRRQPEKAPAPKQSSLQTSFSRSVPYEKKIGKWCTITTAVSYHIAKDMVPVATVEQVGFKKLLKTMDPRYELPSRNYFAREALPQMYTEVRQSLADRLANGTHFGVDQRYVVEQDNVSLYMKRDMFTSFNDWGR